MKRLLRRAGLALAGLAVLVVCAVLGAFAASEVMLRRSYPKTPVTIAASTDDGAVARGRKVALLNGCHDCHGDRMEGRLFHDEMPILRAWGPNLTRIAAKQTDAELDRAIRHGVAGDGRTLWVMPSEAFARLDDSEAADLLAYIRSFPVTGEEQPRTQVGPVGRLGVLMGKFDLAPAMLIKEGDVALPDLGPRHAEGRRIARTCIECHGPALTGREVVKAPDLIMAASYEIEDFEKLLHTGIAAGDREIGLMTGVSRSRFKHLSHAEVQALHDYLKARADKLLSTDRIAATATLPNP
ncbi:cytochrome c [Phenylobacterium sp. J367]|uniref:c-type cytochrome n=1 Tax=Phenylobacterium sp. J367 TaxID=2898435 RepID=UPI002151660E|nr:cytochrome c [Phenylobacterium sp. J367]MCR5878668.1 cytochrome c [Phenylobacterium sp. J367]